MTTTDIRDTISLLEGIYEDHNISKIDLAFRVVEMNPITRKSGTRRYWLIMNPTNTSEYIDCVCLADTISIGNIAKGSPDWKELEPEIYSLNERQEAMIDLMKRFNSLKK